MWVFCAHSVTSGTDYWAFPLFDGTKRAPWHPIQGAEGEYFNSMRHAFRWIFTLFMAFAVGGGILSEATFGSSAPCASCCPCEPGLHGLDTDCCPPSTPTRCPQRTPSPNPTPSLANRAPSVVEASRAPKASGEASRDQAWEQRPSRSILDSQVHAFGISAADPPDPNRRQAILGVFRI